MSEITVLMLGQGSQGAAIFWCIVLVGIVVAGFVGVVWLKRWLKQDAGGAGQGFTLSELRSLRDQGKMSEEEFEKAKVLILGSAKVGVKEGIAEERRRRQQGQQSRPLTGGGDGER